MRINLPRLILLSIVMAGAAGGMRVALPAKVQNALGASRVTFAQPLGAPPGK